MKKILQTIGIISLITLPITFFNTAFISSAQAATSKTQVQKFGVVDAQKFISGIPSFIAAQAQLKEEADKKDKEFAAEDAELRKQHQDLTTKNNTFAAATQSLNDAQRKTRSDALQKEIADFEAKAKAFGDKQQAAEQQFQTKQNEILNAAIAVATKIIDDYAKANNYTFIFNESAVAWFPPANDITDALIKIAVDSKK